MSSSRDEGLTFTVEQANRTLPLVRSIVGDIVRYYARWREMVATCETLGASDSARAGEQLLELQKEIQRTAADIEKFVAELQSLGATLKSFEQGLVDFPAEFEGRPIYLCWQLGESRVDHWHELDAGFSGRVALSERGPQSGGEPDGSDGL